MKRLICILVSVTAFAACYGQQLPIYSHYMFNKFIINPAVAGSDGFTSVDMTARNQWVGYEGSPQTYSLSVQGRFMKRAAKVTNTSKRQMLQSHSNGRVGMGGCIFSDVNGIIKQNGFRYTYSYHLRLRNQKQLSFGLSFTGTHYRIDEKQTTFEDPNEPLLFGNLRKGVFIPDASFGVYLLDRKFSAGFSTDQLFGASAKIGNKMYNNLKIKRRHYLFGEYDFDINISSALKPSVLFVISEDLMPQADIGVTYVYDNKLMAGCFYRTSGALITSLGLNHKNIFIGYSFDFTLNEIQTVTYGTHELSFALRFGDSARRYRWLDRY